jgi:hypothetical protein
MIIEVSKWPNGTEELRRLLGCWHRLRPVIENRIRPAAMNRVPLMARSLRQQAGYRPGEASRDIVPERGVHDGLGAVDPDFGRGRRGRGRGGRPRCDNAPPPSPRCSSVMSPRPGLDITHPAATAETHHTRRAVPHAQGHQISG